MVKTIMIQGTASSAGKSLIAAGLCRIFKQDGYRVAPFKAQNMALNSYVTEEGLEMGRAQVMQAEAAGIVPDVRMNPILLKPNSDQGSQVIVNGEVLGNMPASDYYKLKKELAVQVKHAFDNLAEDYDIIVLEGAGSASEINLREQDLVNMGMAKMVDAPVLLVGDIDRGGVFAALAGTMLLLTEAEKSYVKGTIINKFRGDISILEPGLRQLEELIQVPVVGVVPYLSVQLDDEDSLTERFLPRHASGLVDIAVVRLPRISNFTDFNAFEYMEDVNLRYVDRVQELGEPDLIILPGTKNTLDDLKWLRESGMEGVIMKHASKEKPIIGICGGYQMLGKSLHDPEQNKGAVMAGLGLLDSSTVFALEKIRKKAIGKLPSVAGIFNQLSQLAYEGYEIHMGKTSEESVLTQKGNVYGSYIHGIFDKEQIASTIVKALMEAKGIESGTVKAFEMSSFKEEQYEKLAAGLRKNLDIKYIYQVLNKEV